MHNNSFEDRRAEKLTLDHNKNTALQYYTQPIGKTTSARKLSSNKNQSINGQ